MPKRKLVGQSVRKKAAGSRPEKETVRSRSIQKVGGQQQAAESEGQQLGGEA